MFDSPLQIGQADRADRSGRQIGQAGRETDRADRSGRQIGQTDQANRSDTGKMKSWGLGFVVGQWFRRVPTWFAENMQYETNEIQMSEVPSSFAGILPCFFLAALSCLFQDEILGSGVVVDQWLRFSLCIRVAKCNQVANQYVSIIDILMAVTARSVFDILLGILAMAGSLEVTIVSLVCGLQLAHWDQKIKEISLNHISYFLRTTLCSNCWGFAKTCSLHGAIFQSCLQMACLAGA